MNARHLAAVVFAVLSWPLVGHAQQPSDASTPSPPQTYSPDSEYGEHTITKGGQLPGASLKLAPVDRRDEIDPFSIQGGLLPTAHVPREHTLTYRNQYLFGHQLSFTPTDWLMLTGTAVLSPNQLGVFAGNDHDFFAGAHARVAIVRSRNLTVSLQPGFVWRAGQMEADTRAASGELGVLVDYLPDDRVALTFGLLGHVPVWYGYDREDLSGCETRDEFFEGECVEYVSESAGRPAGGQWVLGYVGATVFAPRNITFKGEVFTGINRGTILGVEGALFNTNDIDNQRRRFEDPQTSFGLVEGGGAPLAASLAVGWSYRGFGVQLAMFGLLGLPDADQDRRGDNSLPAIFPMTTIGYSF